MQENGIDRFSASGKRQLRLSPNIASLIILGIFYLPLLMACAMESPSTSLFLTSLFFPGYWSAIWFIQIAGLDAGVTVGSIFGVPILFLCVLSARRGDAEFVGTCVTATIVSGLNLLSSLIMMRHELW